MKVFSRFIDSGAAPPRADSVSILDAGCGVGVLGICAATAIGDLPGFRTGANAGGEVCVRAQDRDELARIFTEYNARHNGLCQERLTAHAEPLLAAAGKKAAGQAWDIILSNIPAKAGRPVLKDFICRSAACLKPGGLVFLVAVNTLADFFRSCIAAAGANLVREERGKEHSVFVYGGAVQGNGHAADDNALCAPVLFGENFPQDYPFYIRKRGAYEMEGISYRLDTVHGAADFDNPGGAVQAAAKLAVKFSLAAKLRDKNAALLIHDDAGQGHFALWLAHYLARDANGGDFRWVLSGRNVLALATTRAAFGNVGGVPQQRIPPLTIPLADISLDREQFTAAALFAFCAFFPQTLNANTWQGLTALAASGGIVITGASSAEADRFDRKKPEGWIRLGDIKRKGFRALAYQSK